MSTNPQSKEDISQVANPSRVAKRRKLMFAAIQGFLIVAICYGGYFYWQSLFEVDVDTDDAYVEGNLIQITPQVGGTVIAIAADNTQQVQIGQTLVKLDDADSRVALEQAVAHLAQAVRAVREIYAQASVLQSQVVVGQTEVLIAKANLGKVEDAWHRRQGLTGTGAVGVEEQRQAQIAVQVAKNMVATAQAKVKVALARVVVNKVQTEGIILEQNPIVQLAAGRVREAYLTYKRTVIPSPVAGLIARRTVQLGQRVSPGTSLMSVVPLGNVWVGANFKETQLRELRVGQPAKVTADIYGGQVTFKGRVIGISAGSGAAFALLPAQNATGNWIKVVQRIPVRIALEHTQLAKYPLRVGMSIKVTVNITHHTGARVVDEPPTQTKMQTNVYTANWDKANALVKRIITDNSGDILGNPAWISRRSQHHTQSVTEVVP